MIGRPARLFARLSRGDAVATAERSGGRRSATAERSGGRRSATAERSGGRRSATVERSGGRRSATVAVRRSGGRRVATIAALLLAIGIVLASAPTVEPARGQAVADGGGGATGGSAVTVHGRKGVVDDFSSLAVTVSQTRNLTNQAITVSWTGGTPTPRNRPLGVDYLQIMQCWTDPGQAADPAGLKLRERCQFGTELAAPALPSGASTAPSQFANARSLRLAPTPGYPAQDPAETLPGDAQMVPFRPVDRTPSPDGSASSPFPEITEPTPPFRKRPATPVEVLSTYFNDSLTNEYPYALTGGDGTGRVSYEVQNSSLAPDLGCGDPYTDASGVKQPSRPCSLVIVPRGHHHPYTGEDVSTSGSVHGSPFTPALWQNRIEIPLEFQPVGGYCPLGQAERRTAGTEMVAEAVTAWKPALCAGSGGPVIGYSAIGDFEAARQIVSPLPSAPGMVFSSDPVVTTASDPPLVHAPVALSGVVVALNIDVNLDPNVAAGPEFEKMRGIALRDLKLTPRLLAKLLTQSYRRDVPGVPAQPAKNWNSIKQDPEFLDLNPIFRSWDQTPSVTLNGLMVPNRNSVGARALWQWILADPVASAWLNGKADENGMVVNPNYAPLFQGTVPDYFPKADRTCVDATFGGTLYQNCTFDYRPYMGGMSEAAAQTLRADTKGSSPPFLTENLLDGVPKWTKTPREVPGFRFAMSVTDSASAARYGLFTAQLCKASQGTDGRFTANDCRTATTDAMNAAVATAVPSQVSGVTVIDPAKAWATPGAYPLSMLTYAVGNLSGPADARRDYAALLRQAAGPGQQSGTGRGQLPDGYAPLPLSMRAQTLAAADQLQRGQPARSSAPAAAGAAGAAPGGPGAVGAAGAAGVPSAGAPPSRGGTAPAVRPSAQHAAQSTPRSPLGMVRYLLIGALGVALISGVAGPILQRIANRSAPPGNQK